MVILICTDISHPSFTDNVRNLNRTGKARCESLREYEMLILVLDVVDHLLGKSL